MVLNRTAKRALGRAAPGSSRVILVVAILLCLVPACAVAQSQAGRPPSPQSQCGLSPGLPCNQQVAACIAKSLLAPSESALHVTVLDVKADVSHDQVLFSAVAPVWGVMVTTSLGEHGSICGSSGLEVWVSQHDGRIIKSWPWFVDCAS